jgi:hypothetical protein
MSGKKKKTKGEKKKLGRQGSEALENFDGNRQSEALETL